jgi:hypothetical protein
MKTCKEGWMLRGIQIRDDHECANDIVQITLNPLQRLLYYFIARNSCTAERIPLSSVC